jgi:hypothetical protein
LQNAPRDDRKYPRSKELDESGEAADGLRKESPTHLWIRFGDNRGELARLNTVFISYRRQDSPAHAGRLFDQLTAQLGEDQVFMDVDGIAPGEDFVKAISDRLSTCRIFLAIIGPRWAGVRKGLRKRIFRADDFVRVEILVALNRPVLVIPVLVQGATMPLATDLPPSIDALRDRNAISVSDGKFRQELAGLVGVVKKALAEAPQMGESQARAERQRIEGLIRHDLALHQERRRRRLLIAGWGTAAISVIGLALWGLPHLLPTGSAPPLPAQASEADSPRFGHPDPDVTKFRVPHPPDTEAYEKLAHSAVELRPRPFPPSRGGTEPILSFASVWGPAGADQVHAVEKQGKILFHAVGSTGNVHSPANPDRVAKRMTADFAESRGPTPSFFFDLGDVIYSFGEAKYYYDQFYLPYRQYPAPILAVAGNHDGMIAPGTGGTSLQAFLANFCAPRFEKASEDATLGRTPGIQPGVYFTFEAPFVRILALYSNTSEGAGVIWDESGKYSEVGQTQLAFLRAALNRIKSQKYEGAILVLLHHNLYAPSKHGGSRRVLADLDEVSKETGVWPHAVLSGHAHDYQRYTRETGGMQIPYINAGGGGYGLAKFIRGPIVLPMRLEGQDAALEAIDEARYGFLRITVDRKQMHIEYQPVTDSPGQAPTDAVTVNLHTHRIN